MLKGLKKLLVCFSALFFTGCTELNFAVDGLINAPKLTSEQSDIHQALIQSVGSNITLKYPKNGENRSAYVIANIDDEPGDEALVFYQYNSNDSDDNGLRVNVLDKKDDGSWYSVKELAGAGTDIDQVIISPMGNNNETDVLVGYQTISNDEKTLEIYNYDSHDFKRIGVDSYSLLSTLDINADGSNEIITIQKTTNSDTGAVSASASLLSLQSGEIVKSSGIKMCDNVTSYVSSEKGMIDNKNMGLYIDGLNAEGNVQTELIYFRNSKLQNPIQNSKDRLLPLCTRPSGYLCRDVDSDGVIEIPSVSPMTGYEKSLSDDKLYMTSWSSFQLPSGIEEKYKGYYSITDGYFLSFPNRWKNQVTVKKDNNTGELVFYKYSGSLESSTQEIMRIAASSKNESEEYFDDGYELISSKGQLDYLVKLPSDKREQLILTIDEVQNNFYIVD